MLANIQQQQGEQRAWGLALQASEARRRLLAQLAVLFDHVQLLQRQGRLEDAEAALVDALPSLRGGQRLSPGVAGSAASRGDPALGARSYLQRDWPWRGSRD